MAHVNHSCSHEENRVKICAPCGKKIVLGKKSASFYRINTKFTELIQLHVNIQFKINDSKYPLSICNTCRNTLHEHEKKNFTRPLPKMPNYADMVLLKDTRNKISECNCYICLTARMKSHVKTQVGKSHVRNVNVKIDKHNGKYGSSMKLTNISLDRNKSIKKNNIMLICKTCFCEISKGKRHMCNKLRSSHNNLLSIIEQSPDSVQENVAHSLLKKKANISVPHAIENGTKNINLKLKGLGNKELKVVLKPRQNDKIIFSAERLDMYQNSTGTSSKGMRKLTNFLRSQVGRSCVEKDYKKHSSTKSKTLESIYKNGDFEFDVGKTTKEKRPVVWADAEELVEKVLEEREHVGNHFVKVMADGGKGFLKICLSIFPESYISDEKENSDELDQKRTRYSDGGSISKDQKLSSVYKTIILCMVPSVLETYDNLQILFSLTNINNISFKFVSDLKLLLTVNGQQTASSMFPCPYCFISIKDLQYKSNDVILNMKNDSPMEGNYEESHQLKTYGDLKKDFEKYCSIGKQKVHSRMCNSTINSSLIQENDDVYVLEKCVVPELHLLQGFVNHLFWDGLVKLVGKDKALLWPQKLNLVAKNYHGDMFEGNACRKLLKEADKLVDAEITSDPIMIQPYISAFKAMNKVVHGCFSTKKVSTDINKHLEELSKCFYAIPNLSETLKIHILLNHVEDSIDFINNQGLGLWSEQAGESIHHEFSKYWQKYKINSINSYSYSSRLKSAVVECSSRHI